MDGMDGMDDSPNSVFNTWGSYGSLASLAVSFFLGGSSGLQLEKGIYHRKRNGVLS